MNSLEAQWLVAVAVGAVMLLGFLAVYGYQRLRPRSRQAPALGPHPLSVPAQVARTGALDPSARRRESNRVH
jgi:hypothetical protein